MKDFDVFCYALYTVKNGGGPWGGRIVMIVENFEIVL